MLWVWTEPEAISLSSAVSDCLKAFAGDASLVSTNGETFSHTDLYMKYVEATTQCRQERLAKRQIEIMLEQVSDRQWHDDLQSLSGGMEAQAACKWPWVAGDGRN
jgi:hypothetical protein